MFTSEIKQEIAECNLEQCVRAREIKQDLLNATEPYAFDNVAADLELLLAWQEGDDSQPVEWKPLSFDYAKDALKEAHSIVAALDQEPLDAVQATLRTINALDDLVDAAELVEDMTHSDLPHYLQ